MATNHKQAGTQDQSRAVQEPPSATALVPLSELYSRDDEIDLVDVALIFVRRWRLLLAVWVLITAMGFAVAFIKPRNYDYTAATSVGQLVDESGGVQPLESPSELIAKAENGFVPAAIQRAPVDQRDLLAGLAARLKIENVDKTGMITLAVKASERNGKVARTFLSGILNSIMSDQQNRIALIKRQIEGQIAGLNAQIKSARSQLKGVDKAIMSAPGGARAATLEQRAEALMTQVSSYLSQINGLQLKAQGIEAPVAFRQPQRSAKPVGMGRSVIIALAFVLGLFVALFICIMAEFGRNVRSRLSAS